MFFSFIIILFFFFFPFFGQRVYCAYGLSPNSICKLLCFSCTTVPPQGLHFLQLSSLWYYILRDIFSKRFIPRKYHYKDFLSPEINSRRHFAITLFLHFFLQGRLPRDFLPPTFAHLNTLMATYFPLRL